MKCRFIGDMEKKFVPMEERLEENNVDMSSFISKMQLRKIVSDQYFKKVKKNENDTTNGLKQ